MILRFVFLSVISALVILAASSYGFSQNGKITILHTNDMHAAFLPHEAGWVQTDPKPSVGGFQELWWIVDSLRKVKGTTILLDAGDVMTGTPISEFEYKGSTGGALFEMMNLIGYDVWTIGNHDLDISQENLKKLTSIVKFPVVSANLIDSLGNFPFSNREYVVLQKNGLRIGVIGLMSRDLFRLTNTNNLIGLKVLSPVEVTQRIIDKIDPKTDLIIALTHEGVEDDSILASSTHGLDVIIGGHSHTRLKTPKIVNDVVICQAGSNCENLGEIELTVGNDKVTSYDGKLIQLWARYDRPKNTISDMIAEFKEKVDSEYGEVVGTLLADWKRSGSGESNIGDFVSDAIREEAKSDIAVTNSSGIRKDLRAGKITKLDLFEISPFRNYVSTFSISGSELRSFAERHAATLAEGKSPIQISGLKCSWRRIHGKVQIQSLTVGNENVVENKEYSFATSDFVINQADKYLGFEPASVDISKNTVLQALISKVKRDKSINGQIENRFQRVD